MRKLLSASVAVVTLSVLTVPAAPAGASGCRGSRITSTGAAHARALRCLINAARRGHGLRPLRAERHLARAAAGHSRDMVRRRYFAHDAPGGRGFGARVQGTGYGAGRAWSAGETIAYGSGVLGSPRAILRAWLGSPPHRAILLTPGFRDIGLGEAAGTPGGGAGVTVTADLGGR
jgi:uncharacterized protein YkwD